MKFVWIPEHPRAPLYRADMPRREGKAGEILNLCTYDASEALQFATRDECEAWIAANPHPIFKPVEHGFADA